MRRFGAVLLLLIPSALLAQTTAPTTQSSPRKFEPSWREKAEALHVKHDYVGAKALLQKWLEANPPDSMGWYDLACTEALLGNKTASLEALDRAVDAGYSDGQWIQADPDLESVRSEQRFKSAIARIGEIAVAKGPQGFIRRFAPMQTIGTYVVMLPPDYQTSGRAYPVCVILHGNGSTELAHGRLADKFGREGVIYIAVRAPHPRVDEMLAGTEGWTAGLPDNLPADDPARVLNRTAYVQWIFDCVEDARRAYRIQPGKFYIYGHSQGGQFAVNCALVHPERIASVFSEAGSAVSASLLTTENLGKMKQENVRVHLLHGEQDETVSPDDSKSLKQKLDAAGVAATLQLVPGDHTVGPQMVEIARKWLDDEVRSRN